MFPKDIVHNNRGIGLVGAIFVIVVVAMFGLLLVRYTVTTSQTSVEDYVWAQSIYAAEAAAQLRLLYYDGGGNWGAFSFPEVGGFTTAATLDSYTPGSPSTLRVEASRMGVTREVEIKYRF